MSWTNINHRSTGCCKGCEKRRVTADYNCHTDCEEYKQMQEAYAAEKVTRDKYYEARNYDVANTMAIRKRTGKNRWGKWRWGRNGKGR